MRLIKSFLLRLYTDTAVTDRVCGDIRPVDEEVRYPFKNMDDLSVLLHKLVEKPPHSPAPPDEAGCQARHGDPSESDA